MRHPFAGLPRPFWILFGATLVNRVGGFVVPFLALFLSQQRGVPVAQVGVIVAFFGAGSLVAGPLGGALTDRLGRKSTLVLSLFLGAAVMGAVTLARSHAALSLGAFGLGLTLDLARPATSAMVADLVPLAQRTRAYAALYWAHNLGFAFASVVAGLVASASFELLFAVDALSCLATAAIVLVALKETRPAALRRAPLLTDLSQPFRDRAFLGFFGLSLLVALVFFQFHVAMPLDMRAKGVSTAAYGALVALNGVLVVVLTPLSTSLMLRLSRRRALALAALLTGLGFGSMALAESTLGFALAITVLTLGEIAMAPVNPAVVSELAPAHLRGTYQGAFALAMSGGACLAPLVGGALLEQGRADLLWGGALVVSLVAAALHLCAPWGRPPQELDEAAVAAE
jgi:MFS family permease